MAYYIHQLPTGVLIGYENKKLYNLGKPVKLKVILEQLESSNASKATKQKILSEIEEISKSEKKKARVVPEETKVVLAPSKISGWREAWIGQIKVTRSGNYQKVADGWIKV